MKSINARPVLMKEGSITGTQYYALELTVNGETVTLRLSDTDYSRMLEVVNPDSESEEDRNHFNMNMAMLFDQVARKINR